MNPNPLIYPRYTHCIPLKAWNAEKNKEVKLTLSISGLVVWLQEIIYFILHDLWDKK